MAGVDESAVSRCSHGEPGRARVIVKSQRTIITTRRAARSSGSAEGRDGMAPRSPRPRPATTAPAAGRMAVGSVGVTSWAWDRSHSTGGS